MSARLAAELRRAELRHVLEGLPRPVRWGGRPRCARCGARRSLGLLGLLRPCGCGPMTFERIDIASHYSRGRR